MPPYDTPVFVPAHPRYVPGAEPTVVIEFMSHPAGPPVPVAFSTQDRLVAALGEAQPWMTLELGAYATAMRRVRLPAVRLDPVMEAGARKWSVGAVADAYGPVEPSTGPGEAE